MAARLARRLSCRLYRPGTAVLPREFIGKESGSVLSKSRILCQSRALTFSIKVNELQKRYQSTSAALVQNTTEERENEVIEKKNEELLEKVKSAMTEDQHYRRIFAVVHFGGRQHKITTNDIIMVHKIPAKCGEKIKLQKILMLGGREFSLIGKPLLSTELIHIEATVLEKTKGRKVIVFKKKRRKNYKKWQGHRQELTVLRINKIKVNQLVFDSKISNKTI